MRRKTAPKPMKFNRKVSKINYMREGDVPNVAISVNTLPTQEKSDKTITKSMVKSSIIKAPNDSSSDISFDQFEHRFYGRDRSPTKIGKESFISANRYIMIYYSYL